MNIKYPIVVIFQELSLKIDLDHSNSSTILPMEYETVIEYVDETESAKNTNSTKSKSHPKVKRSSFS